MTDGGGIYCINNANPIISHCVFYYNSTVRYGGAIACNASSPIIRNCTIFYCYAGDNGGGIGIFNGSAPSIINTIINCIAGGGGIYIANSPNTLISYGDFYFNSGGNFVGDIPDGMGTLVSVNANGDSCDTFMNIFENPLLVNPTNGDFHLQEATPCIDAGDPNSPLDPDGTCTDIGAFYYHQIVSQIALSADSLFFPDRTVGDTAEIALEIYNQGLADLIIYSMIFGQYPQVFYTNWNIEDSVVAPGGILAVNVYFAPEDTIEYNDFLSIDNNAGQVELFTQGKGLPLSGVNLPHEQVVPDAFTFNPPVPNPFNAETTLSFELASSGWVSIVIYDTKGREITHLTDDWCSVGIHYVTFDASDLPSGLYFARLTAGKFLQTQKLLLIK